ncbi:MAG TPA: peptidase S9, partial [Tenuifilaceae bacterium]|nr:peptidase S9 [Tenuifilaceae bacterium]
MKRICLLLPALGLLLLSCNTHREPSETIIGKSDIVIENGIFTPEALWALGRLGEVAVSPSGMRVAYTVTYYSVDQNRSNTEIFVMNADGSACQQITKTAAHEFNIAWVDDNTIAYISTEGETAQIWTMDARGKNRKQVSNFDGDINGFAISPKGDKILFISDVKIDKATVDIYP